MSSARMRRLVLALLGLSLLGKLWLATQLPLFGDEAFYWLEAQHPAWAHDDVPALTPWLIALGSTLAPGSEWGVRLPFLLLGLLALWLIQRSAQRLVDAAAGWRALALAAVLPLFAMNGLLALPDVPLTLAVLVCLAGLQACLQAPASQAPPAMAVLWLAAGLALGCLSHYRFAVPLLAAGLWLLLDPAGRGLLRWPRFWAAGLGGLALGLAPLLWQQWQNHGRGLLFQFGERHPWQLQPSQLLDPLLQAGVTSPLLYLLLLVAGWRTLRAAAPAQRLFAGFGLLLLACYWLLGAFADNERSRLHWPLPGYLALSVTLAAHWPQLRLGWRRVGKAGAALAALASTAGAIWLLLAAWAPQRLVAFDLYPGNFAGWREAAAQLRQSLQDAPGTRVVVADNFMLAAQLQFALGASVRVYSLDHPLNRKHGRQGELARMQRDEAALARQDAGQPRLLVAEQSASRLRARPAWFARLCQRYPQAQPIFDLSLHHGMKRLLGWRDRGDPADSCLPPALGYLDPLPHPLRAGATIQGWALRGGIGIDELRYRLGDQSWAIERDRDLPSLRVALGGVFDPQGTAVGFSARIPTELPIGSHWLRLEARSGGEAWAEVARVRVP